MSAQELQNLKVFESTVERLLNVKFEEFKTSLAKELKLKKNQSPLVSNENLKINDVKYLKAGEAAKLLNVSTRTLQRWRKSCNIPHITRRGLAYYSQKDIMAILSGELDITRSKDEDTQPIKRGRKPILNDY